MPQNLKTEPKKADKISHVMRVAIYNNMKRRKQRLPVPVPEE